MCRKWVIVSQLNDFVITINMASYTQVNLQKMKSFNEEQVIR